jgi:topoisomerase-4 subunit A
MTDDKTKKSYDSSNISIKKFGDERRTLIEEAEMADSSIAEPVIDEPATIIVSKKGWLRSRSGHSVNIDKLNFKEGDKLLTTVQMRTVDPLLVMDVEGRVYTINTSDIPGGKGDGVPINSLVAMTPNVKIHSVFSAGKSARIILSSNDGYGFVAETKNMIAQKKAGKAVHKIAPGAKALQPIFLDEGDDLVVVANSTGYVSLFPLEQIGTYPSAARGNKLHSLKDGVLLSYISAGGGTVSLPSGSSAHQVMSPEEVESYTRKRASRGRLAPKWSSLKRN